MDATKNTKVNDLSNSLIKLESSVASLNFFVEGLHTHTKVPTTDDNKKVLDVKESFEEIYNQAPEKIEQQATRILELLQQLSNIIYG